MPLLVLLTAALLAVIMGYAIQRGATCTVAAVDEVLTKRKANRLHALLEAAIWVLGGLLIARALGFASPTPVGYAVTGLTVLGAALLGMGAAVNRACVFGAVARFGSGEWAYLATPVGFYLGNLLGQVPLSSFPPRPLSETALAFGAPSAMAWLLAAWMIWRLARPLRPGSVAKKMWAKGLVTKVWEPHAATLVIAVTFFFMLWLVGPWAYTDVLSEWAQGKIGNIWTRGLLLVALLAGASLGGWTAGRFHSQRINLSAIARYLAGGALMGLGSVLIPGGNDGLILTGMPLLWPYAWLAFAVMCLTIAVMLKTMPMQKA
jgi:hypothetical protein